MEGFHIYLACWKRELCPVDRNAEQAARPNRTVGKILKRQLRKIIF